MSGEIQVIQQAGQQGLLTEGLELGDLSWDTIGVPRGTSKDEGLKHDHLAEPVVGVLPVIGVGVNVNLFEGIAEKKNLGGKFSRKIVVRELDLSDFAGGTTTLDTVPGAVVGLGHPTKLTVPWIKGCARDEFVGTGV